ncbi:MAG TPA: hypothetical protein PLG34_03100 [Spirochaetota bacterium]|nr:hypothetical protein [Spirochaetota bacterium]HPY86950.1 hypothetical protein [Spirochaetota bacterium]
MRLSIVNKRVSLLFSVMPLSSNEVLNGLYLNFFIIKSLLKSFLNIVLEFKSTT